MEHKPEMHNDFDSSKVGRVVNDLIKEWGLATFSNDILRRGKADDRSTLFRVPPISGSGFAPPSVSRRLIAGYKNGSQHLESDPESSFNGASEAEES